MSGEPLTGPSMISFLEGGVEKIFFLGGGDKGRGQEYGIWTWNGALSKLSGLPYPCVCYRSKSHYNHYHHHHLATMINDLIINDNN